MPWWQHDLDPQGEVCWDRPDCSLPRIERQLRRSPRSPAKIHDKREQILGPEYPDTLAGEPDIVTEDEFGELFAVAWCRGWLCAAGIEGDGEVSAGDDELVVAASVFKVAVALEVYSTAIGTAAARVVAHLRRK